MSRTRSLSTDEQGAITGLTGATTTGTLRTDDGIYDSLQIERIFGTVPIEVADLKRAAVRLRQNEADGVDKVYDRNRTVPIRITAQWQLSVRHSVRAQYDYDHRERNRQRP
jgi:hypothetical protein